MAGHWLRLDGIAFQCVIGVTERERAAVQDVVVDLRVRMDFTRAAASDDLRDTIDYRRLAQRIVEAGSASSFQLVESLVVHLARVVLDEFAQVSAVRVEVEKPRALKAARSVRAIVRLRR